MKILSLQAMVPDLQSVKNCAFLKSLSIYSFCGTTLVELGKSVLGFKIIIGNWGYDLLLWFFPTISNICRGAGARQNQ